MNDGAVSGADEYAGAALHAEVYFELCKLGAVLLLEGFGDSRRIEAHRAVVDAVAAVDAGGLRRELRVFLAEGKDCVGVFKNGLVKVRNGNTHHRTAVKSLFGLLFESAAKIEYVLHRGTDGGNDVFGRSRQR